MSEKKFNILIPVDLSKESTEGLRTGLEISRMIDGKVTVFNVTTEITRMMEHYYHDFKHISSAFKTGIKNLDNEKELVKKDIAEAISNMGFGDMPVEVVIRTGFYKDTLRQYLKENDMDLIVMGTNGKSTLTEYFNDDRPTKSIKAGDVPVLAVKKSLTKGHFQRMMLGVELKKYDKEAVDAIRQIAELLDMKVYIVHVKQSTYEQREESMRFLEDFARSYGFKNYELEVIGQGEVYKQLDKYAKGINSDIIASISQGNNFFFTLLFGSNTEELFAFSDKPILSIVE